ncbi:hypothetical protein [Nostoc sp. ChiQUE01b]|uniref:hypothetical protein n=1 Tax=Nostoc sp. ChiQUE01b TaxID=3075376 RepID=UPI002AD2019F|nr:hypothetical protein [Nostoc sp. ChiQUE01b]MDZ8257480.1 hypothetical protein [Nostoc sp. ChiQUE01b]
MQRFLHYIRRVQAVLFFTTLILCLWLSHPSLTIGHKVVSRDNDSQIVRFNAVSTARTYTNSPKYSYTWTAGSRGRVICSQDLEKWYKTVNDGGREFLNLFKVRSL